MFPKVLVPNALPVAFCCCCPNKPAFDVPGWAGVVELNPPPLELKVDVPPPNAPNPVLGFAAPNIDGLLLPPPNAPDEARVSRVPNGNKRDKPNVEPPVAGVGLGGLEARFPNIEFACCGCCCGFGPKPPPDPNARWKK